MKTVRTKNFEIECKVARTKWEKSIGLMLKRNINPLLYVFTEERKQAFHTMFMLKPIDIVFINSKKIIVEKITARPFKLLIIPKKPVKYVIELPKGLKEKFNIGERVSIT